MEYLMTYGWAILIIAVVLGALFQLGVFNSSSFSPRAPPGACQVFRPSGPGTTTNINLMGVCTGQLPQYATQFNGQTSYAYAPYSASLAVTGQFSVSYWFSSALPSTTSFDGALISTRYPTAMTFDERLVGNNFNGYGIGLHGNIGSGTGYLSFAVNYNAWNFNVNQWYNVVNVFTTTGCSIFLDGVNVSTCSYSGTPSLLDSNSNFYIGSQGGSSVFFKGFISNVQVYNTSLTANQVQALYLRGMGGAPMKLQNIVGWWPLNGNTNDYGGNNNNAVPYNGVTFTSQYGK